MCVLFGLKYCDFFVLLTNLAFSTFIKSKCCKERSIIMLMLMFANCRSVWLIFITFTDFLFFINHKATRRETRISPGLGNMFSRAILGQ